MVFLPSLLLSQKSLDIQYDTKTPLDSIEYDGDIIKYKIDGNNLYYAGIKGNDLLIYNSRPLQNDKLIFRFQLREEGKYFLDFVIEEESNLYLLFQKELFYFKLKDDQLVYQLAESYKNQSFDTNFSNIYRTNNKVVLTNCYNHAVDEEDDKCPYLVLDKENLSKIKQENLPHDAIGLTHIPSYFYDVNYGKILFINTLKKQAFVYNLDDDSSVYTIGDGQLLNEGVEKLPFSTHIVPYTNAKDVVRNVSIYSKTINYIEGGFFLNDTTLFLVEKTKSKKISSKRILHFYRYDKNKDEWNFYISKSFKNKKHSKKYKMLQFYYSTGIQIKDNKLYFCELYLPKESINPFKINRYLSDIFNYENFIYGIYEYKINL